MEVFESIIVEQWKKGVLGRERIELETVSSTALPLCDLI